MKRSAALKWIDDTSRAYSKAFSTPAGKAVLADLLEFANFGKAMPEYDDQHKIDRALGRVNVAQRILDFAMLDTPILAEKYLTDAAQVRQPADGDGLE
jgi:hypothetical protein